ncbi:MAG: UDP-glucose/GDP-mannose dehydrogenase family protein [Candidatus Cloacimonas sp.]|nr:UDP-glucose/GDP-mannose dehydrogenase family protein [Candidatus Cloacimonadota bacterium]
MNLTVIGSGYVGLVTGTCFAEMGNQVICVDNDETKIKQLNEGIIPIYEPGLEQMVVRNHQDSRLLFTTDLKEAVGKSLLCFIAVGTPPEEDGSADLSNVLAVAKEIASCMNDYRIIVTKSTVPVGTAKLVENVVTDTLAERGVNIDFDVVSNPEFLKEGNAIEDFMKPDRVVVGTDNLKVAEIMKTLYAPFNRSNDRVLVMSVKSAEMTKYAANAMLATKISFINEIAKLCELTGADIAEVRNGIGSDTRIGYKFIYPGVGYGGSCFPKDVKALIKTGVDNGYRLKILSAVEEVNFNQKKVLVDKVKQHFGENLTGKTFGVWGLSFKPQTDDMREAPSIVIINALTAAGAKIQAYDPIAMTEAKRVFAGNDKITYTENSYDAAQNADALLLITEWHQFRYPDFARIKEALKTPVIFDGRNQYDPDEMKKLGFTHYSIGRRVDK